jgi:hypothetical protein
MTGQRARIPVGAAMRVRYAVLGLVVGGLWLRSSGTPAWEHGLRVLVIMMVVPPTLGRLAAAAARRRGRTPMAGISLVRLLMFKGTLTVIAMAVSIVADGRIPHLDLYVAVWLALMLAFGGPALHHHLLTPAHRAKTPDTQKTEGAG